MSSTGSERLDFAVEQVWGPDISRGNARALVEDGVPQGWEVREGYWVVPNLKSAQLLVPQNRRVAIRTLADFAGLRGPKVRLARRLLAGGVGIGLPLSTSKLCVASPIGGPATTVAQIGALVGQPEALATFGVRTAANAKPTLELRAPDGNAIGFVKLGWNPVTMRAVENEGHSLKLMGSESRTAIRAPRVLADGLIDGRQFVMTEPLPRGIQHIPGSFSSLTDAEALGPGTVHRWAPISDAAQVQLVLGVLARTFRHATEHLVGQVRDLARRVASLDGEMPIATFWHGDFTWWNTGRDQNGQVWLFDWETAEQDAPAGMDTLHWYTHTVDAENPNSLVGRADAALEHCSRLLRSLGHSSRGVATLAAWYTVTLVANEIRLAESLGSWDRIKHPPLVLERFLVWGSRQLEAS